MKTPMTLSLCALLIGCQPTPAPPATSATARDSVSRAGVSTGASQGVEDAATPRAVSPDLEATPKTAPSLDPVERFSRAMRAVAACPRENDGLTLSSPDACLAPVREARESIIHPKAVAAATEEARETLKRDLARSLENLLTHREPTVVLYTLSEHQALFQPSPETLSRLETQMEALLEPVAEAAARARFDLRGAEPEATLKLALSTFEGHGQRRVKHAACQHLGSKRYHGSKEIFQALMSSAKDPEVELLLRSCAARGLAQIGTKRDLRRIASLLELKELQQALIVGLQRGLGTDDAIDTYLRFFERHATRPDKLHWTAMHVLLPWDSELSRMPRNRTIKVLKRIAGHAPHATKVRLVAIEGLKRMKATEAIEALARTSSPDTPPELLEALGPKANGQSDPTGDKRNPADRGDGAKPALPAQDE